MEEKVLQMLEKEFEESELKHTCFDNLKELKEDKTLVQINAPRALIACELLGRWKGFLKGFKRSFEESKKLKKIVDKLIKFEKQIEDFADRGTSYARFRSWDVYGELRGALWKYAPYLKYPKEICNNCGHDIRRVPDLGNKKIYIHDSNHCMDNVCRASIKANKKIRQKSRHTEPIKYLQCDCSNPKPKEVTALLP